MNQYEEFWQCMVCGNILLRPDRPTKCFHCRNGENDKKTGDEGRLFSRVESLNKMKSMFSSIIENFPEEDV